MNKQKLKATIIANGDTQNDLAKALGISVSNLSLRINGRREFKLSEIETIVDRYNISGDEIKAIFFANEVS